MQPNDVLQQFEPSTAAWFTQQVGTPTPVQQQGWPAIAKGGHVLISAPTGTGKTLSAFLVFIDRLKAMARSGEIAQGIHLIYISPLKALGNDIRENLRRPLDGIDGPTLSVAIRTGDTTQAERRRMLKHPPNILITTPESLYILLSSQSGQQMLMSARAVILDELHAMINTKRGAHLMLSLARLDRLCGHPLQRIGLSATIEPLEGAAGYLACPDPVTIVAPPMHKDASIEVNGPLEDMRVLPEGTIWPEIARQVVKHSETARTVIAFVEGRQQAEKLALYINRIAGDGFARTHHGCVSKEQRLEAEQQLRSGELRVLCATSSMELGIDVGEVDLVLQLGYPRTISSTMQRLGRAGHNPGRTSVMHMFPRTLGEIITCGLTARVALDGGIEESSPPERCLDVLAQHLVSMAATGRYHVDEVLDVTHRAYNFRSLTREDITSVLEMLAGDFEHEQDRPVRPRLLYDRIHGTVEGDRYSQMLALSAGGTIPDRGFFPVRLPDGTRLGELDETFVFEARIGDKFLLGAFAWRVEELRRDSVIVSPTTPEGAQPPFWLGDRSGRPLKTGYAFGRLMRGVQQAAEAGRLMAALRELTMDDFAARNGAYWISRQLEICGCLPDDRTLVVEHFADEAGDDQLMVHSLFGGRINAGLAVLMQEVIRREVGIDVSTFDDDDGFLIYPYGESRDIPEGLLYRISPDTAAAVLKAALPATPLFSITFRYNASRALMMGVRKGQRQPLWVQRMRGAQAMEEAVSTPQHPLMQETTRECLQDHWDLPGIQRILDDIQAGVIQVREVRLKGPSPMALPLRRMAESVLMYEYSPTPRGVHRAVAQSLDALDAERMIAPAPEQLSRAQERGRQPQDAAQLHTLLMTEGDLISGEVDVPIDWLQQLAWSERAQYIEPGLWIAAEQAALYHAALVDGDVTAQKRILRRLLRYRGAQSVDGAASRYVIDPVAIKALLDALVQEGQAVRDGDLYYHAELYQRAQRATVSMRREQVKTLPPARYAAMLAARTRVTAAPGEQLREALASLQGQAYPPALWEQTLLPARCGGYKPQMLDALLAEGEFFWQLHPGDRPLLSFHRACDIDWARDALAFGAELPENLTRLTDALMQRGASFAPALSGVLSGGESVLDALMALMARGLVRADSFAPVRQWLDPSKTARSASARVRSGARVKASLSGRWELTRPLMECTYEDRLYAALTRAKVLCRETALDLPWGEALETLRVWEYTGRVRRGYFISGLSGAQFIAEDLYARTTLQLARPTTDILWLNAADPDQAWGKVLPHAEGRSFVNVAGTAVALRAGEPVCVLERQGQVLRVFDDEALADALAAFASAYAQGRVFGQHARILIKQYPQSARPAMEKAGFVRQMLEYELWQKRI